MTLDTNTGTATDTTKDTEIPMRILHIGECFSLSQRSTLTYQVLCDQTNAIFFRIAKNSAAGLFSRDAVSMATISRLLSGTEKINGATLQESLFQSQSRNSGAFLLAALVAEALIEKIPDERGGYRTSDPTSFLQRIQRLIASGVELSEDAAPEDAPMVAEPTAAKRGRPKKA